ncbi:MAG: pitrilysin family protein [Candidatus Eisenbacteria bacterium]
MSRLSIPVSPRAATLLCLLIATAVLFRPSPAISGKIVDHPDKLKFEELDYRPPAPAEFRRTLRCGATVYVAENHEVPTFDLTVLVRTGEMYEPVEKAGLGDMTAHLMRNGGVEGMTAREFDERIALLAAEISVSIGNDRGRADLFCLSKDIDEGLDLFAKVLRRPAFDPALIERYRTDVLSDLEQRNSSTSSIESREWQFLIYGDHPCTVPYRRTAASVKSITREDLVAYHRNHFFPKNFVVAVSGDFETAGILAKLDAMLEGWPDRALTLPAVPDDIPPPKPGVYMIAKEDVNQSRIRVGHLGVKRDIPDQYALMVMNEILGGGGFTSRIVRRVRSDEGLAYNAGSWFDRPVEYPGTFRAWFQTKHATAAFGTAIILEEIRRMIDEKCDPEAVENAKAGFISDVVNPFSSRRAIVNTFASDDYTDRPDGYWAEYTDHMKAVTPEDVQAAAREHLHPDRLVFLVVGDPDAVEAGSDEHEERFSDFGEVTILPLRDPMTLE